MIMPGLTHIGLAFIVKIFTPNIPLWCLLLATEFIDIICIIFVLLKIEQIPTDKTPPKAPYSHGLFMAIIWTIIAGLITYFIEKHISTSLIISGMVFSHWVLDFIASPMTFVYKKDEGKPIFFQNSKKIGLGLWSSKKKCNYWRIYIHSFCNIIVFYNNNKRVIPYLKYCHFIPKYTSSCLAFYI